MMAGIGSRGIFWVVAAAGASVVAFAVTRAVVGPRPPQVRGRMQPFPMRAGAGAVDLLARHFHGVRRPRIKKRH
jgi:hypothetical protein